MHTLLYPMHSPPLFSTKPSGKVVRFSELITRSRCFRCPRRNDHGHFLSPVLLEAVCLSAGTNLQLIHPRDPALGPSAAWRHKLLLSHCFQFRSSIFRTRNTLLKLLKPQTPSFCHFMFLVTCLDLFFAPIVVPLLEESFS